MTTPCPPETNQLEGLQRSKMQVEMHNALLEATKDWHELIAVTEDERSRISDEEWNALRKEFIVERKPARSER
jgi:hypothetical protein